MKEWHHGIYKSRDVALILPSKNIFHFGWSKWGAFSQRIA